MAFNQTRRLTPAQIEADEFTFNAVMALADFSPANGNFAKPSLKQFNDELKAKLLTEQNAAAALGNARDDLVAAQWQRHNAPLGAAMAVAAQYGDDSNEYQTLGRKKKSERKRPARRSGKTTASY